MKLFIILSTNGIATPMLVSYVCSLFGSRIALSLSIFLPV